MRDHIGSIGCHPVFFNFDLDIFRDDCLINHPIYAHWSCENILPVFDKAFHYFYPKLMKVLLWHFISPANEGSRIWTKLDWKRQFSWHKLYANISPWLRSLEYHSWTGSSSKWRTLFIHLIKTTNFWNGRWNTGQIALSVRECSVEE